MLIADSVHVTIVVPVKGELRSQGGASIDAAMMQSQYQSKGMREA